MLKNIIEIGIAIEIENYDRNDLLDPDFDNDFDFGKGISSTTIA